MRGVNRLSSVFRVIPACEGADGCLTFLFYYLEGSIIIHI